MDNSARRKQLDALRAFQEETTLLEDIKKVWARFDDKEQAQIVAGTVSGAYLALRHWNAARKGEYAKAIYYVVLWAATNANYATQWREHQLKKGSYSVKISGGNLSLVHNVIERQTADRAANLSQRSSRA
jgi:hypothetical protein